MKTFVQVQQQFMDHIKDPQSQPSVDGIEDRRLAIYRELFFNNVKSFVSAGFPVLKSLYDDKVWVAMVRDFFIKHDCHSPYFADISKEFVQYLVDEHEAHPEDPPFLVELAHYEWVELDVSIRKEAHDYQWITAQEVEKVPMVVSETAWPLGYAYPVHQISTDFIPTEPTQGNVHLVVYRDDEDDVQFMLVNAVTAMLLQTLTENPGIKLDTLLNSLVKALAQFEEQQITDGAIEVVLNLVGKGIIRRYCV
jgi:hypothetical protein